MRSCDDCRRWIYDDEGKIKRHPITDERMPRPKQAPTPCSTCPKKNPDQAPAYTLSAKNAQAVDLYRRTRAVSGRNLTNDQVNDLLLQRNMSTIDQILRAHENQKQVDALLQVFTVAMTGGKR